MKKSVCKVFGWSNRSRWFNPLKVLREQLDGPDRLRVFSSSRHAHRGKRFFLRSPPPPDRHCQVQLVTFSKQNTQSAGYEVQLNFIGAVPLVLYEHGEACSDMSRSPQAWDAHPPGELNFPRLTFSHTSRSTSLKTLLVKMCFSIQTQLLLRSVAAHTSSIESRLDRRSGVTGGRGAFWDTLLAEGGFCRFVNSEIPRCRQKLCAEDM